MTPEHSIQQSFWRQFPDKVGETYSDIGHLLDFIEVYFISIRIREIHCSAKGFHIVAKRFTKPRKLISEAFKTVIMKTKKLANRRLRIIDFRDLSFNIGNLIDDRSNLCSNIDLIGGKRTHLALANAEPENVLDILMKCSSKPFELTGETFQRRFGTAKTLIALFIGIDRTDLCRNIREFYANLSDLCGDQGVFGVDFFNRLVKNFTCFLIESETVHKKNIVSQMIAQRVDIT